MSATEALRRLQLALCRAYGVEPEPHVGAFVELVEQSDAREALLVREEPDGLEVRLRVPRQAVEAAGRGLAPGALDATCQLVEGVSHFVLIAERARRELPTTQLELELQAEVDKFVVLLGPTRDLPRDRVRARAARLRAALFERVRFLHAASSARGQRYRLANRLAWAYTGRLTEELARRRDVAPVLRRFHAAGPRDKVALALAA